MHPHKKNPAQAKGENSIRIKTPKIPYLPPPRRALLIKSPSRECLAR